VRDVVSSVTWAVKELKAYRQVRVEPGHRWWWTWNLPVAACSLVNAKGQRVVEAGEFELLVGRSSRSRDLMAVRFSVVE
jgi:beta-glucosidase